MDERWRRGKREERRVERRGKRTNTPAISDSGRLSEYGTVSHDGASGLQHSDTSSSAVSGLAAGTHGL